MKSPPHVVLLVMFLIYVTFYPCDVMEYESSYDGEHHYGYHNQVNIYAFNHHYQ